jgi:outer membrane protein OmpA-like peptidoglycan-associated protein
MRQALVAVALSTAFAACAPVGERGATGRGAQRAANAAGTPQAVSDTTSRTSPAVIVVLLPKGSGAGGSILVRSGDQQVLIEGSFGAAQVYPDGELERLALQPVEVQRQFSEALSALPQRPATFLLYFEGNSDRLTTDSSGQLQKIFSEIKRQAPAEISVTGHTDRSGSLRHNEELSLARARRVRDELLRAGAAPGQFINVVGCGERQPLLQTDDNVPEPRNRRVEINVR